MNILYLEDDVNLSETVQEYLSENGFNVECVYDGEEALEKVYIQNYDLLLLDVHIPKINGFELLKELRSAKVFTPAIFITSLNSIQDLSLGYDAGADDYIKKPFELKELHFRIKALLKREFQTQDNILHINDDALYNTHLNELIVKGKVIALKPKELSLLKLLLKNKNRTVPFEKIFQNVWSFEETHSNLSLKTYVKKLRQFLGKETIVSIKKVGYKLV